MSQLNLDDPIRKVERVWYCPECDGIYVMAQSHGYMFTNEHGSFILVFENLSFKTHELYLIGDL